MFPIQPKFRKLEMLIKNELPTPSEINKYHGELLSNVICNFGNPDTKKFLGIEPPMKGPGDNLWISPNDQLIDNVKLTPIISDSNVKAFTHDSILSKNWPNDNDKI
ncbi:uncharacterized protein LOC122856518 [Aphidius gifuensis]|uniref:uncharacterized protein LOC122856518 n=1 Tax=Aphidius gifuensis TaxID=684658 RepID=UPI001CDC179B|nr:uncharacterized protein LOC122856518 [Aphidius gifuensis]